MKNNVKTKEQSKNFSAKKSSGNFYVAIDKEPAGNVSLKKLLKSRLFGAVSSHDLKIQLVIAQHIHVDLIDDLIDFDITGSRIEVVLNQASSLHYDLKILQNDNDTSFSDNFICEPMLCTPRSFHQSFNEGGSLREDYWRRIIEKELDFKFVGEHSFAKIRCLCKGTNDSIFKLKTLQYHQASYTKSDLLIKGAFLKQSKFLCDSLIKIEKKLQKVEANQLNKNLLIGCNSKAVSIPKLEVKSNDVTCRHGATVSKLQNDHLFYLQSRGIDLCFAKNILIDSFLS